jgi:AraC family transcriptional regulator of adaptative response/methylated-DNA-[protein]-cysteine methyltransferase
MDGDRGEPMRRLRAYWPGAHFIDDPGFTSPSAQTIMTAWRGGDVPRFDIHLFGTNFQIQVWQALLKIPSGAAVSYKDVADYIGKPKASRAVGGAVGANPISLLIPCHRVIQQSGIIENYGWGTARKKLILALESQNLT